MNLPKTLETAVVIANAEVSPNIKKLVIYAPQMAPQANPGQFVHLKVSSGNDPLLRRPFSIGAVNLNDNSLSIYYRIVGRGTDMMARLKQNDVVDCLGPLGRGFELTGKRPLLIGGGMGIAPLLFLAERLCPRPSHVLIGGRTETELFWQSLFKESCERIVMTTDDGSVGMRGTTVDVLPDLLVENVDMIYACGPKIMMQGVAEQARKAGVPCQVSLEEHMACGLGACLSCTCQAADGTRKKVCADGPVFWAEEVVW
ncbi:Dihydroorotate dehydrogenase B (NAD(+)), electron transfer subunit [bioreactor metagenome]|uniref:Dihydroorotate dehydrogenase B (NAD(+)), electron transfer subunit n=1 Tax=bioreactor metagenome TaxID=1076179 RepID=A0A645C534_9ZZZZ